MNKFSIMAKGIVIAMGMVGVVYAGNNTSRSLLDGWTGFYVGMNAGLVFNKVQLRSQHLGFTSPSDTCNTSANFLSLSPGMQLGYMYQFPNDLVSGIEANVTLNANQSNSLSCTSNFNPNVYDRFTFRNQMQTAIKGRIGRALAWNNSTLLPYLTVGTSFAKVGLTYKNEGGDYYSQNAIKPGWLIGAGIEWAFRQHWSLRAEYSYVNYGKAINLTLPSLYGLLDPNGKARVYLSANNFTVVINYWI